MSPFPISICALWSNLNPGRRLVCVIEWHDSLPVIWDKINEHLEHSLLLTIEAISIPANWKRCFFFFLFVPLTFSILASMVCELRWVTKKKKEEEEEKERRRSDKLDEKEKKWARQGYTARQAGKSRLDGMWENVFFFRSPIIVQELAIQLAL